MSSRLVAQKGVFRPNGGVKAPEGMITRQSVNLTALTRRFRDLLLPANKSTSSTVRRIRFILTMLLVALWLPGSSHALLQFAGLIHQWHPDHDADSTGSHEHDADDHEAADGHCLLSSVDVHIPAPEAIGTPLLVCSLGLEWDSGLRVVHNAAGLSPPGTAPPQLSHRWQFSSRTALPPRAPSRIS